MKSRTEAIRRFSLRLSRVAAMTSLVSGHFEALFPVIAMIDTISHD